MWTTSCRIGGCLILLAASFSLAQDGVDPKQPPRPGEREDARMERDRPGGHGAAHRLLKQMKKDLALDDVQSEAVKRILDSYNEETRELHKSLRQSPETMERLREIRHAMREARESDDKARLDELKAELRKIRDERRDRMGPYVEKLDQLRSDTHDKILAEMREDQKEKFETLWEHSMVPHRGRHQTGRDPGDLRVIVRRLTDLTDEQRTHIDEVFDAYRKEARKVRDDPEATKKTVDKLFKDILNLLNPEQRESVEKKIKQRERRDEERRGLHERRGPRGGGHRKDKAEQAE